MSQTRPDNTCAFSSMAFSRRDAMRAGAALLAGGASSASPSPAPVPGALSLNEDNSHFFFTRAGKKLDTQLVDSWVDQYAGTQVRELIISVNCMRTSYASKVWDPIWRGFDSNQGPNQPLFASLAPAGRQGAYNWVHTAWQLNENGIDVYTRWLARARQFGLAPWLSMRMNDCHNNDDVQCYIHSEFWRSHPEYWRVPYYFTRLPDRALDYGRPEVREYNMKLVRELAERYDFDGLELDWMRFGYHFRAGHESEGLALLTEFTAEVRTLLNEWERKRGHLIRLGARVPTRPETATGLGMDAVGWARKGLIDMLTVAPFWATIETDIPVELWKELLRGTNVTLAAGVEVLLRAYPDSRLMQYNSIATVRGAAASLLDRGADRIYLFNYMDGDKTLDELVPYPELLRETGSLETLHGMPRRHVLTYADTWAVGEPRAVALPIALEPGQWRSIRLPTGPKPSSGSAQARLAIEGVTEENVRAWPLRVNGTLCNFAGIAKETKPLPATPLFAFDVPPAALNRGYNLIEFEPRQSGRVVWAEFAFA